MPDPQPSRWGRVAVLAPALVVAACAVAATAHGGYEVAVASQVPEGFVSALYPLITDGLALVAYAATHRFSQRSARIYAWTVVVLAAALSGLAQAVYLASGPALDTSPVLRFGVGAWPAVAGAVAAHLVYLLARRPVQDAAGAKTLSSSPNPASLEIADLTPEVEPDGFTVVVDEDSDSEVQPARSLSFESTDVYRALDSSGRLLYVGVTTRLADRINEHRSTKPWWPDVAEVLSETYPDRAIALAVEHSAIANEHPEHNLTRGGLRDHGGGVADPAAFVLRSRRLLRHGEPVLDASTCLAPESGSVEDVMQSEGVTRNAAQRRVHLVRSAVDQTPATKPAGRRPVAPTKHDHGSGRRSLADLTPDEKARIPKLVAQGYGRPRLAEELRISSHEARKLLEDLRNSGTA